MSDRRNQVVVQATGLLAVAWGTLLLTRGDRLWRTVDGASATPVDELAIRALGARHLIQGAAQVVAPTHLQRVFVAVDLIHTTTMLALAAADNGRRRPALLTAGVAAASAATTLAVRAAR
ncbi:MAG: hypothetical protein ABIW80_06215 [Lapillicoccus sp.]